MIQFTDSKSNKLIEFSYTTKLNQITNMFILEFDIKYICPNFNGEYIYFTEDDIGEPVLLYKLFETTEFEIFDLYQTTLTINEAYETIGKFIEHIKYGILMYEKYTLKEVKKIIKKSKKDLNDLNFGE